MIDQRSGEIVKKVVGEKKHTDVWDELYRLNVFAAKLGLLRSTDNGHPLRKVVGKPRQG
jgi:hypothetical protein